MGCRRFADESAVAGGEEEEGCDGRGCGEQGPDVKNVRETAVAHHLVVGEEDEGGGGEQYLGGRRGIAQGDPGDGGEQERGDGDVEEEAVGREVFGDAGGETEPDPESGPGGEDELGAAAFPAVESLVVGEGGGTRHGFLLAESIGGFGGGEKGDFRTNQDISTATSIGLGWM
jgi:hypothetical protein